MEGGVWLQSSGSDGWFVSYAPPSLTQAGIQAVDATGSPIPGSFSMQPVSATLNLVAPSDGSLLMRIAGTNLGVCPTVTVGFAQVLLCPDARRNLTATPGAVLDANGLTFPVPRGEGAGFSVVVVAGDQNTASQAWSLSYAPAVVTWTAAADVTAGTPTSGGTRIFLSGRGFGTHIAGSPTAWGWDSNAIASSVTSRWVRSLDDPMPPLVDIGPLVISSAPGSPAVLGWAPCKNVIRINDTAMTCMAPEGDGASLQLRVTVGNSPAIISAAGSFAYDAPSVLSVECSGVGCGAWGNATAATALWTPSSNATVQVGVSVKATVLRAPSIAYACLLRNCAGCSHWWLQSNSTRNKLRRCLCSSRRICTSLLRFPPVALPPWCVVERPLLQRPRGFPWRGRTTKLGHRVAIAYLALIRCPGRPWNAHYRALDRRKLFARWVG